MIARRDGRMLQEPTIAGLDLEEHHLLTNWLTGARAKGIDAAIDFARRPWDAGELESVIGVFKTDRALASWLLVRYRRQWVMVTVADETISAVCDSLADALALIHVPDAQQ
jgi:hypothetical protein